MSPPASTPLCLGTPHDGYPSAYSLIRPGMFLGSHTHENFQKNWTLQALQRREESEARERLTRETTSPYRTLLVFQELEVLLTHGGAHRSTG